MGMRRGVGARKEGGRGPLEMNSLLEVGPTGLPPSRWLSAPGLCKDAQVQPARLVMSAVGRVWDGHLPGHCGSWNLGAECWRRCIPKRSETRELWDWPGRKVTCRMSPVLKQPGGTCMLPGQPPPPAQRDRQDGAPPGRTEATKSRPW